MDPYHQWLAIPPEEQPPNLYRLLGCKEFEQQPSVIESAADRQMTHIRTFQSGKHSALSQQLLNEISAARVVLLNADKKAAYDQKLRSELDAKSANASNIRSTTTEPLFAAEPKAVAERTKSGKSSFMLLAVGGIVGLFVLIAGAIAVTQFTASPEVAQHAGDPAQNDPAQNEKVATDETSDDDDSDTLKVPLAEDNSASETNNEPDVEDDLSQPTSPTEQSPSEQPSTDTKTNEPSDASSGNPEVAETSPVIPPQAAKAQLPSAAERAAAEKKIAEIFEFETLKSDADRLGIAEKLISTAEDSEDPAIRFMLLNLGREFAAKGGQMNLAWQAIDSLAAEYDFETQQVQLLTLGEGISAAIPIEEKREVLEVGTDWVSQLIENKENESAEKVIAELLKLARRLDDAPRQKLLLEQRTRVAETLEWETKATAAKETLAQTPDEAAANQTLGQYYLKMEQDWQAALPYLAKAESSPLADAAKLEQQEERDLSDKEKLADLWWQIAEAETDSALKRVYEQHCLEQYAEIVDKLNGLTQAKVKKRMAALHAAGGQPDIASALPKNLLTLFDPKAHVVQGEWLRDGDSVYCKTGGLAFLPVTIDAYEYTVETTFTREGVYHFSLVLPVKDRFVTAVMSVTYGAGRPTSGGFAEISGNNLWKNNTRKEHPRLDDSKSHKLTYTVKVEEDDATLSISLDGNLLTTYEGPVSALSAWGEPPPAGHLGLSLTDGATTYQEMTLSVKDGKATLDRNNN